VDPAKFKSPYLTKESIEQVAFGLRAKYRSLQPIPIEVLAFAEFDLHLDFDFAPIGHLNQDAFLRPNLTGILFQEATFKDAGYQDRLRFSAAHELGHLFLHGNIYGALNFTTVKQWISFITAIPASQYAWIECQADEFAGQFLMPTQELSVALDETINEAEKEGIFGLGKEEVLEFCCRAMRPDFRVSFQAMQTRIRKSKMWPHPKISALPN